MSLRDRILAMDDIGRKTVVVPEWEVEVEIRTMSAAARAKMMTGITSEGEVDIEKFYPSLILAGVYDPETDAPLFASEDTDELMAKSAKAVEFLAREVMAFSGMNEGAVDAEGKDS